MPHTPDDYIPCPTCAEEVIAGWDICQACGSYIPASYRPWEDDDAS